MYIIPPDSYRDGGSISNTKIFQLGVDFEVAIQFTPPAGVLISLLFEIDEKNLECEDSSIKNIIFFFCSFGLNQKNHADSKREG
jgi:hypothetical protein